MTDSQLVLDLLSLALGIALQLRGLAFGLPGHLAGGPFGFRGIGTGSRVGGFFNLDCKYWLASG